MLINKQNIVYNSGEKIVAWKEPKFTTDFINRHRTARMVVSCCSIGAVLVTCGYLK